MMPLLPAFEAEVDSAAASTLRYVQTLLPLSGEGMGGK